MQKTLGRVPKQCWHLLKVGLPEIISVHASDLWVTCQCPKVADSKAYCLLTTLLKMKCVVPPYREILWVTTFILENCSIYCERQMSFSLVAAVFDCRGLATSGDSKEHPPSHLVLCFHGIFLLAFVSTWCSCSVGTECCLSDFVVLFVSLTDSLPPWCGSVLTSDPSSPPPYLIPVFLRIMGDMFSHHSVNLEVAGVSSGRFVGSPE